MINGVDGNMVMVLVDWLLFVQFEVVWLIESVDFKMQFFCVVFVMEDDGFMFEIIVLQYNLQKYLVVDYGMWIDSWLIMVILLLVQLLLINVVLFIYSMIDQGIVVIMMVVGWQFVVGVIVYIVDWCWDNGEWVSVGWIGL